MDILIPAPPDFSFEETLSAHGWRRLLPFVWSDDAQTLARAGEIGGRLVTLTLSAAEGAVRAETDMDCDEAALTAQVRRMLQLDLPLDAFHAYCLSRPELASLAECRRGRLLRCPTLWEDAVKAVCKVS